MLPVLVLLILLVSSLFLPFLFIFKILKFSCFLFSGYISSVFYLPFIITFVCYLFLIIFLFTSVIILKQNINIVDTYTNMFYQKCVNTFKN